MTFHLSLPSYVVINDPFSQKKEVLRKPAKKVSFPLNTETQEIIRKLELKFNQEDNCAGLAAPQVGYGVRIIVFAVNPDEELKKFRPDLSDFLPKSIWINPSFKPLSQKKTLDECVVKV